MVVMTTKAYGLQAIDMVHIDYKGKKTSLTIHDQYTASRSSLIYLTLFLVNLILGNIKIFWFQRQKGWWIVTYLMTGSIETKDDFWNM